MAAKRSKTAKTKKTERKEPPGLKPFYLLIGVIAVIGVGILVYQATTQARPTVAPVPLTLTPDELEQVEPVPRGDPDAPVVIEEFVDFQCPSCGRFATQIAPVIKQRYLETGQVQWQFYHFPLVGVFEHGFLAARASRCALDQDRFWDYHDVLHARRPGWSTEGDPTGSFVQYARELNLDRRAFEDCLRSDRHAEDVTAHLQVGISRGVQGTPTIFVNGDPVRELTVSAMEAAIQDAMQNGAMDDPDPAEPEA